jgi:hypothetical protein
MNTKTGLFAVGLAIVAGALTVSCGGSDGGDESNTSGTSMGGSSNTAGSSTAGTSSNTGGTSSNTGGTSSNTGGTSSNTGGRNNDGGDNGFPGFGGDNGGPGGDLEACDAAVMDGEACEQGDQACEAASGETCFCGGQGGGREWTCVDDGGFGDGGAGPGIPTVDCGAAPMMGDDCEGTGLCEGSESCGCNDGEVICFMIP